MYFHVIGMALRMSNGNYWVLRKTSFASFSRCPAGLVYLGKGLTINGLGYS